MNSSKMQQLVVVTSTPQFGEIVRQQVLAAASRITRKALPTKTKTLKMTANPAGTTRLKWTRMLAKRSGPGCGIG
jgi:hypothetical protein